jgi:nucleoside-specific outer membrane channel protein Tsx
MFKWIGLLCLSFIVFSNASATSISVLKGDNFRDDQGYRSTRTTLTIENFSVWEYGTVFFYYDITEPTGRDQGPKYYSNQFFGGIAATLSLSRLSGKDLSYDGILRDVSLRYEIENGSAVGAANFQNYFYGLQYDLLIPGFDFFSFNTVLRDNPRVHGVGFQLGFFWQSTWEYSQNARFKFTGFLATSPWDGNNNDKDFGLLDPKGRYLSTQPQLLYDLGYALRGEKDSMEVGFEYAYFLNRFQFRNYDEKALQAMIKLSF